MLTLPLLLHMSSHSSPIHSHAPVADETSPLTGVMDIVSAPSPNPLEIPFAFASTVSSHTRSKVRVLNPQEADIAMKSISPHLGVSDTIPLSLHSPRDKKEVDSHNDSSSMEEIDLFPDIFEPLPYDNQVIPLNPTDHEDDPVDEATETCPAEIAVHMPSCDNLCSSMKKVKLDNLLEVCTLGCTLYPRQIKNATGSINLSLIKPSHVLFCLLNFLN